MLKNLTSAVLAIVCFAGFVFAQDPPSPKPELNYFFSPSCHVCHEIREQVIARIETKYKDRVTISFRDISQIEDYKLLLAFKQKYGLNHKGSVPAAQFGEKLLSGKKEISEGLEKLIASKLDKGSPLEDPGPNADLVKSFLSFTPLTVIGAGLIDGINPCAFTVIVFFISFLALQGYRKKELAVIGLFFIFAVFLTYLLIGLGMFTFFYSLKGFWVLRKVFNLTVGILTLIFGMIAAFDLGKFLKTGKTEAMSLQLPRAVKNQIHKVIGEHYRKNKEASAPSRSGSFLKLVATALVTGFLISVLEAVCTGQVYLPTIAFVLKSTDIRLKAFSYLVLYNLMFVLPLFAIFLCALAGTTSEDFSRFLKKHFLLSKVLIAVLFYVLGIYLILRS